MSRLFMGLLLSVGLSLVLPAEVQANKKITTIVRDKSNNLVKKLFPGLRPHARSTKVEPINMSHLSAGMRGLLTIYSTRGVADPKDSAVLSPMISMQYITPQDGRGKGSPHLTQISYSEAIGNTDLTLPGAGSLTRSGAYSAARSFGKRAARALFPDASIKSIKVKRTYFGDAPFFDATVKLDNGVQIMAHGAMDFRDNANRGADRLHSPRISIFHSL